MSQTEGANLPVMCTDHAVFPSFEDIDKRLESFPRTQDSLNKQQLALAGFFFQLHTVRCFYCGIVLPPHCWTGHCPFTLHKQRSPTCDYIKDLQIFPLIGLNPSGQLTEDQVLDILRRVTENNTCQFQIRIPDKVLSKTSEHLFAQNRMLREQFQCKICFSNSVTSLFLPCGHLVTCTKCSERCVQCIACDKDILARMLINRI